MNEESHRRAGRRGSSSFNGSLVGGRLKHDDLDVGYRMMAEAADWVDGTSEAMVDDRVLTPLHLQDT